LRNTEQRERNRLKADEFCASVVYGGSEKIDQIFHAKSAANSVKLF
jgi:hypothetical protein